MEVGNGFTGFLVISANLPCSVTDLSFHGSLQGTENKMSGREEGAAGRRRTHQSEAESKVQAAARLKDEADGALPRAVSLM